MFTPNNSSSIVGAGYKLKVKYHFPNKKGNPVKQRRNNLVMNSVGKYRSSKREGVNSNNNIIIIIIMNSEI